MLFALILTSFVKASGPTLVAPPNSFHPFGQQSSSNASRSLTNDPRDKALTMANIDPSKSHNLRFLKDVNYDMGAFTKFINTDPRAKEQLNALLSNYGILSPDAMGETNGLSLPDTKHILKDVEEALAIHESFKEFLRRLLESVQQYLSRSSMLLAEYVIKLKGKYSQIMTVMKNYQSTNSDLLKNQFAKELIDLRTESEELIEGFKKIAKWRSEVISGVSASL